MFTICRYFALASLACPFFAASLQARLTVLERTTGERTSSHVEVLAFINSLVHHGARMRAGTLGTSPQGRLLALPALKTVDVP